MPRPEAYLWKRRVCEILERETLTQARLAERVGAAVNTVARWKRGENVPRRSYQEKLLRILDEAIRSEGFACYLRERTRILTLEASGRKAVSEERKTIIVTAPIVAEFPWDFYSDGDLRKVRVAPGHVSRVFERGGKTYHIQDLETSLRAGREFKISCTVELVDSFLLDHEWTAFEITVPTEYCKMTIRFPKERRYKAYSIMKMPRGRQHRGQGPAEEKDGKEGPELEWAIDRPRFGCTYTLSWIW